VHVLLVPGHACPQVRDQQVHDKHVRAKAQQYYDDSDDPDEEDYPSECVGRRSDSQDAPGWRRRPSCVQAAAATATRLPLAIAR
jgi:hypothetical protein